MLAELPGGVKPGDDGDAGIADAPECQARRQRKATAEKSRAQEPAAGEPGSGGRTVNRLCLLQSVLQPPRRSTFGHSRPLPHSPGGG
jgi:hypothetical protein